MSLLSAELTATCNALGYYDEKTKKYYADENTLETVKDLIRYLRKDDENHDIRRQLGETKVLQADLLPLLKSYWEETELFDVLIKLLVNLTTPPLILWNEEVPSDKTVRNYFIQVEDHLGSYKIAFADGALWAVLSSRLSKILETEYTDRGDDNSLIIERILVLIRNILYVPADPLIERRPDNDANTHDQVSWALHESGILDIILYIASSAHEQAYHVYILEILSHLLREQNATELGKTELHRNHAEKVKNEAELVTIRHREAIKKQQKTKQFSGARHSRFGGTYVVKSMKSISDNELIYHKPLGRLDNINFDADKQKVRTPKNRLPVHMEPVERRSAFTIRLFLKEFCVEFLNGAYNTLMYNVKDQLVRAKSQSHDASFYLWAMRFFMEFNRSYKFEVKLVSETMSIQIFHYVQQQMEKYFDMIQTDKKKLREWSRRLHIALLAYRELLLTLCFMDKSPDGTVRDSSKVIKSNIYYVLEYRELVLTLMVTYDELKMSDQYLKDLIETQHIFLRSFEAFCKDGSVIVQQASKSRKKKKNVAPTSVTQGNNLEQQWDEASQQLSTVLETNSVIPTDIVPFDATSEVPIDQQKSEAMINVQRKLRRGDYEEGVGLLRAAREVWPENDCFGSNHMSPEEEFIALRDIFLANLGENEVAVQQQPIYDENDEEEEDEGEIEFSERDLKFEDFAKRLAHPKIIRAAALALSRFEENSVNTNNCIIKLLHRIAFDCKMYVMLFQVSLFMTFRKIYAMKEMPEYKELVKFSTYILRQFFKIAQENKKIYLESLFWKSTKDAFDVEHGYGSYQEKSSAAARAWTEEEEDEVRRLFMEHKEKQLEDDVVDWVLSNLIDNTRTRRGVFKKMKELYLLTDYKGKKKPRLTSRLQQQWTSDEEEQLIELYEQFKEAMDPLDCIMSRLDTPRQKNRIIEKLLVLGVIQDRKEVRKKRVKTGTKSRSGGARHNPRRSDDSSDSDASGDDATRRTTASSNPPRSAGPTKKKKPKKTGVVANVSPRRLAELTLGIMQAGMNEALNWLKESFEDAIEDFDDDADEGIPLVPIMDHAVKAMEDENFHNLLLALGIAKPSDEQEAYWRIPSDMNLETMKSYQELFRKALENNLTIPEEELQVPVTSEIQDMESSDEDVFAQLRRSTVKVINEEAHEQASDSRDTIKRRRESSSDDITEPGETEALIRKQKSKKKKTRIVESNILSDEENSHQIEEDTNVDEIINIRKSNRRVIDDDDSNNSPTVPELNAEQIKGSDSSSDEDIFDKLKKLSNINSSEGESEDEIRVKRRRRVFIPEENGTNETEDLLAIAEEKLKNERRKKNLAKKEKKKSNSKKNSNDGEKAKTEKKTKNAAPKASSSTNFKSKEFISSEDDSSDDEESKRRVEEHYEKLLHKDFQDNKERKEITSKTLEGQNNNSSEDEQVVSKKVTTSDKAKTNEEGMTGSSDENASDTEENSSNNEPNKENIDTNKTSNNIVMAKPKKLKKVVFSSDDD